MLVLKTLYPPSLLWSYGGRRRCFLDEVRTFFDENPNAEFWTLRPAAARFARCPAKKFSSHFLFCARPIFSSKRKRKLFCWPLLWTSRAAGLRFGSGEAEFPPHPPSASPSLGRPFFRRIWSAYFAKQNAPPELMLPLPRPSRARATIRNSLKIHLQFLKN